MQTKPIRVLSVEDHPIVREGLATVIGSQSDMVLVAQAANAADAITQFRIAAASAYVLKSMTNTEMLNVIRSVHSGRRHIPAEVAARLAERLGAEDLTSRATRVECRHRSLKLSA